MKFQDKFYDVIDHNKYPSSEKSAEKCILRNSYFHHSEPNHRIKRKLLSLLVLKLRRKLDSEDKITVPSNITYTEVVNEQQQDTTITTFDPMEMPCYSLKLNVDAKPFIPAITIKKEEADADDCMKITSKNLMYEN